MIKSNFHTHSTYCDGADTIEEMVISAIEKGFTDLGFSGHGFTSDDSSYCMTEEGTIQYLRDIDAVKLKYADKINIYRGIEKDYISVESNDKYDFVIGSCHYILKDGIYYSVDMSPDGLKKVISAFDGDVLAAAKEFFRSEADVVRKTDCDIIGHFDLISKYFTACGVEITPEYLQLAEEAVDALVPYGKPFEINTGAIARGIDHGIYPSVDILKMIYERGGKITLCSDCHNRNNLDCYYRESLEIAKEIGFKSIVSRHGDTFEEFDINEFKY